MSSRYEPSEATPPASGAGQDPNDPLPGDCDPGVCPTCGHDGETQESDATFAEVAAQRDDFREKWQRALADFQNFQRRSLESEREARRQGATSVLNSLIPVLDHFDMAIGQLTPSAETSAMYEGFVAIRAALLASLEPHGVRAIRPLPGDEFDPRLHQAIMQSPSDDLPAGSIAMTIQTGYALGDRIVRPANVSIVAEPADGSGAGPAHATEC